MIGEREDTIFALSSGRPPAGLAIIRISGPHADTALAAMTPRLPPPRRLAFSPLTNPVSSELLDMAMSVRFPGPASATGENVVELHLHGGRAVVDAVERTLAAIPGLRLAEPGEFTRRAFENGRIDLAEAEGLSDLLSAETESQRRNALAMAGGTVSRQVDRWRDCLLRLSAQVEARLDFTDDIEDEEILPPSFQGGVAGLADEIAGWLGRPAAERLKDGVRVVVAGPPNAGKSTLVNALAGRDAAIVSPVAGTTRDLIEVPVAIDGIPMVLIDTAGLRATDDVVERIGVSRAQHSLDRADIVLWLGDTDDVADRTRAITVAAKADLGCASPKADVEVSVYENQGLDELVTMLSERAAQLLPGDTETALNRRQRDLLESAHQSLMETLGESDLLISAEHLRRARGALDKITGTTGVEDMLDALFGSFCIGK